MFHIAKHVTYCKLECETCYIANQNCKEEMRGHEQSWGTLEINNNLL